MKRKIQFTLVALLALSSGAVRAGLNYRAWNTSVSDGWFTNAVNWLGSTVPVETNDVTRFFVTFGAADKDCRVRFTDFDSESLALSMQLYYPSRFILDLTDATYRMVGTEVPRNRDGLWYPFHLLYNKGSTSYAIQMNGLSQNCDPVLTWTNTVATFANQETGRFDCSFVGGLVDFVPGWSTLNRFGWSISFDNDADVKQYALRLDNVEMRVPTFYWGGFSQDARLIITNGASLTTYGHFYFPNALKAGATNAIEIVDGGRLICWSPGYNVNLSSSADAERRFSLRVAGAGSVLDLSERKEQSFNGANVTLESGTIYAPSNNLMFAGDTDNASAKLTVNGGYLGVKRAGTTDKPAHLYVARKTTGTGEIEINGGQVIFYPKGSTYASNDSSALFGPGTASLTMNGGEFSIGDLDLGYSGGTKDTWQTFTMNGGTSRVSRLYLGASRNDSLKWQHPTVCLNGGLLISPSIYVHSDVCEAFKQNSLFTANGGTVQVTANIDGWISNFGRAEIGAQGLTLDTLTWNPAIAQAFTNKTGEEGVLVKRGLGILFMKMASYDVARTVVEEGTLKFGLSDITLGTELVITNGATVSLEDAGVYACSRLTVDALTVPNGKIVLDKGDVIHVRTDRLHVDGLTVTFTTAPTKDEAVNVFTFDGDVTTNLSVRSAMRRLLVSNAVADTDYASYAMTYDATTQKTTLSRTVRTKESALTDKTVWNGPSWNAEGWSAGVPTSALIASFENDAAPKSVTVPTTAEAGALAFASDGYAFAGDNELLISAGEGAARIDVTAGNPVFNLPLASLYTVGMELADATSLTLADGFRDGGIAKTGKGRLVLDGAATFGKTTSIGGGLNTVRSGAALATRQASVEIRATSDTLRFAASDGEPMTVASKVRLASSLSPSNAIIVKADSDVTFADFGVSSGVLIKRGAGKMTVCANPDAKTVLNASHGTGKSNNYTIKGTAQTTFADDGTAPTLETEYCGFNVAEGELEIVGRPGDRDVTIQTSVLVGMNVAGEATATNQPRLTVNGATVSNTSSGHGTLGHVLASSGDLATAPELKVVGGGSITFPTLRVGVSGNNDGAFPRVTVTNGSILCANALEMTQIYSAKAGDRGAVYRLKDATLATTATQNQWGHKILGAIDAAFDNVFWGGLNVPAILTWSQYACGEVNMRGGTFAISRIVAAADSHKLGRDFTLAFDDTLWSWGSGDLTVAADVLRPQSYGHLKMVGTGLRVAPVEGETFTTLYPFEGEGGFVKEGAGTAVFGANAYAFAGLLDIRGGIVDLTEAGTVAAVTACGPGTLKGATVTKLTLRESLEGTTVSRVPILDGVTACRIIVDFGRDETNPVDPNALNNLIVATLQNSTSATTYKLTGTGVPHLQGTFAIEEDNLVLKSTRVSGLLMIVR